MTDQLSAESRRLLQQVGEALSPQAVDRARGWAQLQAQIPVDLGALGSQGAAAGKAALKTALLAKWAAVGTLVLAGAAGLWWSRGRAPVPPLPAPARAPAGVPAAPPARAEPGEPQVVVSPEPSPPVDVVHSAKSPKASLGAEAELLHSARQALQAGKLDVAAGKLREHARLYPRSQLSAARSLLRTKLLCAQGNVSSARAEAQKLRAFAGGSSEVTGLAGTCVAE